MEETKLRLITDKRDTTITNDLYTVNFRVGTRDESVLVEVFGGSTEEQDIFSSTVHELALHTSILSDKTIMFKSVIKETR